MIANLTGDWPWILAVVVIVFGGSQLPKLAKNAGEAMKEFRKATNEAHTGSADTSAAPPAQVPAPSMAATAFPATPLPAGVPTTPSTPATASDDKVTLTRSELDALLAHREAQARSANTPPAGS